MRKSKYTTLTILTLIVMLLLAACSGNQSSTPNSGQTDPGKAVPEKPSEGTESTEPKAGGSIVITVASDPLVINPLYTNDRVSLTISQALFAPLYQVNNGEKTFYLADNLTHSEDYLSYTLTLKSGLTWHDGQPLTADDVVFTIEKILDESQHTSKRSSLLINNQPVQASKTNDTTIEFKLPQPSPAFESALLSIRPIPKHIFENEADLEKSPANNAPVGSGPFKFKEYKTGEYFAVERFDNYFGGKPYLDTVIYRIVKDTNTANLALQNGELNVKYLDAQDVPTIEASGKFDVQPYSEGRLAYLAFNQNSEVEALKKKEVRQALSHALNQEELIQLSYVSTEYADPAKSALTQDVLFHTNDVQFNDYDPEKAKQMLSEAGVSGLKLRFIVQSGNKSQEAQSLYIQQKFKEIGVEVELQNMDSSAWVAKFVEPNAKDFELVITGYIMGYDPSAYYNLYTTTGGSNYTHYSNPRVDELFEQGAAEIDPAKRGNIYKEIQEIIAQDAVIYPFAYTKTIVAVDKRYGGLDEAVLKPVVIFEDLSKIYLK
ncbi:ABC transporter substrate-binding protein [Paenibacillaceae bacterium]|nr:ABC transporter substrate-binding protein [Paenibacillaceae bacterium]